MYNGEDTMKVSEYQNLIPGTVATRSKMIELNNHLERMNFMYHTLGKPEITDEEYDALYNELVRLEELNPMSKIAGGITSKVGSVTLEGLSKVKHYLPLLSLKKVHSVAETIDFIKDIKGPVIANGKLDGLALELVYSDQVLYKAITRGDGEIGEDVTEVVKTIRNIPKRLPLYAPQGIIEIRGETVIPIEAFNKMNAKLIEEKKEPYANPRNAVSGILRSLDVVDVLDKPLAFFAYGLGRWDETYSKPTGFHTAMSYLVQLGFSHKRYHILNGVRTEKETEDWVTDIINRFTTLRPNYDIEIDGIVFAPDSFEVRESMGSTSQYPKHSIAYKFPASTAVSVLKSVDWQVGRTGVLTPVANIEPVEVHGVTVSRVTLHNPLELQRLDIHLGDTVIVSRQGDVIPKITKVLSELRTDDRPIIVPSECPVCSSDTILNEEGTYLYCTGTSVCGGRLITGIEHYASREAMNIRGLGAGVIKLLADKSYLTSIADIYKLHEVKDELYKIEGLGKRSIDNLLAEIEKSKYTDLYRFIYAIGINGVGLGTAKRLVKHFDNSFDDIKGASPSQLLEVEDIGEITAELIYLYFQTHKNLEMLYDIIINHGVWFTEGSEDRLVKWFEDQRWVVTGSFEILSRAQWENILEQRGAKISKSVTDKTDCLLVADSSHESTKMTKAKELGVRIVQERELSELVKNAHETNSQLKIKLF